MSIHLIRTCKAAALLTLAVPVAMAASYPTTVQTDNPLAYYRFDDSLVRGNTNINLGSVGLARATNLNVRSFAGAIAGSSDRALFFNGRARSMIPFNSALNPPATQPFTMEVWLYPASDQTAPGQAPINNRYAYGGVDRQGWVIFQRSPNDTYSGEPPGWNFRMFRGSGSATGLDIRSPLPYEVGKWTHMVVVYEPNNVTDATLTMYLNGEEAVSAAWPGDTDAYAANTGGHPASEAPFGDAGLSFGGYNNTGDTANGPDWVNGYFGGLDEFAFYTNKLTPAKILEHYQNGTNANRAVTYSALVQADHPVAYLPFDELPPTPATTINLGELREAGEPTSTDKVQRNRPGAIVSEPNDRSFGYHLRNGAGSRTTIPFKPENNPEEGLPFSIEVWVKPETDQVEPGVVVINNRKPITNRTGWVIFQRKPNASYPSGEAVGYQLRLYTGAGGSGQDINTGVEYKIGEWQQLVFTWEPEILDPIPDPLPINRTGKLTAYVNGQLVAENFGATYKANTLVPEDASTPADFAVGSYNAASGFGQEFTGSIDEVAFYNNYALTAEQVQAHYDAATNSSPAINYETLVQGAPVETLTPKQNRKGPATYLRFNDSAPFPAANSGTLGSAADGTLISLTNNAPGPRFNAFPGFSTLNTAVSIQNTNAWVSLNDPAGLEFNGNITMEAWIKPALTQGARARIISHGPALLTVYTNNIDNNYSLLSSPETFLAIDESGANYVAGASDGTNTIMASSSVPAGDLGTTTWIHLAGTFDGTNWKLYRNGVLVNTTASTNGNTVVTNGNWAIGATGAGWGDSFNGSIDEVTIFNTALSASRIQAHYTSATTLSAGPTISITVSGGKPSITFAGGELREATSASGTYSTVNGATSPYQPAATDTMRFYQAFTP